MHAVQHVLNRVASAVASYHCCVQGMGLAWRLLVLALGSMNIFPVPTEIYSFTSYEKCTKLMY